MVRDVIAQAEERQKTSQGTNYAGAVLQYLVGAKLDCALGKGLIEHNSFSTADAPAAEPVISSSAMSLFTSRHLPARR